MQRLLLDTNILLWWLGLEAFEWEQHPEITSLLRSPQNHKFISAISLSEIAIKKSIGKIDCDMAVLEKYLHHAPVIELPFSHGHAFALGKLPMLKNHKDPFDRMLVAQAQSEQLTLITSDRALSAYEKKIPIIFINR